MRSQSTTRVGYLISLHAWNIERQCIDRGWANTLYRPISHRRRKIIRFLSNREPRREFRLSQCPAEAAISSTRFAPPGPSDSRLHKRKVGFGRFNEARRRKPRRLIVTIILSVLPISPRSRSPPPPSPILRKRRAIWRLIIRLIIR